MYSGNMFKCHWQYFYDIQRIDEATTIDEITQKKKKKFFNYYTKVLLNR